MNRIIRVVEDDVPAILLGIMVALVTADVFGRYVLDSPIPWATEVTQISFIWSVYLGAVGVTRRRRHIAVDVLGQRLSGRSRAALDSIVGLIVVAVLSAITWQAYLFVTTTHFTTLPATGWSRQTVSIAVLVSTAGMLLHTLAHLASAVHGVVTGSYVVEQQHLSEFDDIEPGPVDVDRVGTMPR